jgi:CheY-like chemotaxis protein
MPNILVVDDSSDTREPLMKLLRLYGHGVSAAADGLEALHSIEEHAPDLILLDVMMPHMDGLTFLKHLRDHQSLSKLPVIIVSAVTDERVVKKCTDLGVHSYLTKARFTFPQLLAKVAEALNPGSGPNGGGGAPPPTMQWHA